MLISRKVAVKVIVTEDFKISLVARLRDALQKVELTQQQLDLQGRRYLAELKGKDPAQGESFGRRLERQSREQEEIRSRLLGELNDAESLQLGAEYYQGTLEGLTEVRIGDRLSDKANAAEIVVRDGFVVEMRGD